MPNVSKKTKNYKKRYMSKRKRFYKKNLLPFKPQRIVRTGFPRTTMVKLKYVEGFQLDPGTVGLASTYVYRANSIYDPNSTGTGHQPMNRDMWATLYKKYTVVGSKITLRCFSSNTSNSHGIMLGILLKDVGTVSDLRPETLMEQGLCKYTMGASNIVQNSGRGLIVSKTYSAKKFFNVVNVMDNKDLGAFQNENPVRTCKFVCILSPVPGSLVDHFNIQCVVTIEYLVVYSEPIEQAQS
jgi:hypothetical protein